MALRLTPDQLASAYDFLRTTEPFRNWKLPEADDIGFHVVKDNNMAADFGLDKDGIMTIRVSEKANGHTNTLLMTIAHEAIHLYQHLKKLDKGGVHNADFWRRARRVCNAHGWDVTVF